jgi:hypothetical protein
MRMEFNETNLRIIAEDARDRGYFGKLFPDDKAFAKIVRGRFEEGEHVLEIGKFVPREERDYRSSNRYERNGDRPADSSRV